MASPVRLDVAMPGLNGNASILMTPQGYTGVRDSRKDPVRGSLKVDTQKMKEQWRSAIGRAGISSAKKKKYTGGAITV